MRRKERPASFDYFSPVCLEGIRDVVQAHSEARAKKKICQPIYRQFVPGIVDHAATANEARAKNCIPTCVQQLPISDHIAAVIRLVRHHHYDCIPRHMIEAESDGAAESMLAVIFHRLQC